MDKNLFLAVALSIGVYATWYTFVEKPKLNAKPPITAPAMAEKAKGEPAVPVAELSRKELLAQAESFAFENQQWRVHPRGAALISAEYLGPLGAVELVENPNPGFFSTFPQLQFKRDPKAANPTFEARGQDGARVIKEFVPGTEKELPRLRIRLVNPGKTAVRVPAWTLTVGPGLGTVPSEQKENHSVWRAVGLLPAEGALKGKLEVFKKPGEHAAPYRWVGVDNRYFLAALLPPREGISKIESAVPPLLKLDAKEAELPAGGEHVLEIPFYLGAKSNNKLVTYGQGLERAIDFGFFAQLGRIVVRSLGVIHEKTGNWGWSIIILTLLLQVLLFPLTYKSLKAAAAMKKVQPELARLQQKWGKDPQRMNQEMMELYKKSGANPLGGCLPMVLQMPIFIALFNALRNSWELHGAAWVLWITDLSSKDPYYVLPIIMGALMVLQQRLQPAASADPAQQKMMQFMPVIFTFMFLKFPAGLVLYWTTNSVVSTALQLALKGHFERSA